MSWYPLEYIPRQHINVGTGLPYSGAVLKAYAAQTTTNIPMATDFTGATTATSFTLNAAGYVTFGGNVIIPHVEQACKLALYPNQAAADANSGAVWTYDNIQAATGGNAERFINFASDVGSADAYVIAPNPAVTAYAIGQIVTLLPANTNTGTSTLAISGLATRSIKKMVGGVSVNVGAGDLQANVPIFMFYNGVDFILMNASAALLARGTALASAATVDLGAADSDYVEISGTTTITSLGTGTARNHVWVKFQGALTLTHNATSLILPTAANITTAAGDAAEFVRITGGNWQCLNYNRASGSPLAGVVDRAYAQYTTVLDVGGIIPQDNTIPQNTEGTEIMSVSITPKSTTNRLRVRTGITAACSTTSGGSAAIFRDSTADALFAFSCGNADASLPSTTTGEFEFVPGTTSSVTIRVRVGPIASGLMRVNANNGGARLFGGVGLCSLVVEEIGA